MSEETQRRGHGSGLHTKVEMTRVEMISRFDKIDRHNEASRQDYRELDRHVVGLKVQIEGLQRSVDDVKRNAEARLTETKNAIEEKLKDITGKHKALDERFGKMAERVSKVERKVAVNAARIAIVAGAGGAGGGLIFGLAQMFGGG